MKISKMRKQFLNENSLVSINVIESVEYFLFKYAHNEYVRTYAVIVYKD